MPVWNVVLLLRLGWKRDKKRSVEINGKNNENRAWRRSGKPMWNTHDFDLNKDMRLHEEERANRFRRGSLDIQRQKWSLNADLWLKTCIWWVAGVTKLIHINQSAVISSRLCFLSNTTGTWYSCRYTPWVTCWNWLWNLLVFRCSCSKTSASRSQTH